jgi:hypothetical protein
VPNPSKARIVERARLEDRTREYSSISDLEAQGSNLIPGYATLGVQATLWFDVLSDAARVRNADRKVSGAEMPTWVRRLAGFVERIAA